MRYLQCIDRKYCADATWETPQDLEVSEDFQVKNYPKCPYCGKTARPNVCMFEDNAWISHRYKFQKEKFNAFKKSIWKISQALLLLK